MSDITVAGIGYGPPEKFKDLGDGTWARYIALEPASIGAGGGTSSSVSISDGVTATTKATVTASNALKVDGSAVTQPVSIGGSVAVTGPLTDVQLRASVVPVSIPGSVAVTGTFWQTTQPVSGTFWQATQPVSIAGTISNNIAQIVGAAPSATNPLPVRLTDGTSFYTASGGSGGNLATAAKGTTVAGNPTSEATDANRQSLHVNVVNFPASQTVSGSVSVSNFPATQPVSIASMPSTPVTGTFWQATQPVSLATNTPDVTDRAARLLGHVTVDNASIPVTGTFWQATQPVSIAAAVTVNQGTANATPWNENIAQIGGTAIAAKALPTNAVGQTAIPVWANAMQFATYEASIDNISSGALVASTDKAIFNVSVAATGTKTIKIRRVLISYTVTTAPAAAYWVAMRVYRGTAAITSTALSPAPTPTNPATPAASSAWGTLASAGVGATRLRSQVMGNAAASVLHTVNSFILYDWQEGGETQPWVLRPGVIDTLTFSVVSNSTPTVAVFAVVTFTEE